MPPNRYATPEVLAEIQRLKAALHREGKAYVCEPDPPGMWSKHGGKRWQNMSAEEKEAAKAKLCGSAKTHGVRK